MIPRMRAEGTANPALFLLLQPAHSQQDSVQQRFRAWRTARDVDVHRDHLVYAAAGGVVRSEYAAADAAGAYGYNQLGIRGRIVGLAEGQFHVPGHRAGDQQHIGVARGRDEVDAEALDIVDGVVEGHDFQLAPVARSGVHLTDGERTAQDAVDLAGELAADLRGAATREIHRI